MFSGFRDDTFEFFMALAFNNNREFFHANHDWYERSVRRPLCELCADLAPVLLAIDRDIEVRSARVVSHINRDLRYSRDKSPYRDYMWLGFHRAGLDKRDCFHYYFDIGAQGGNIGIGMYGDDRAWTDALRRAIVCDSDGAFDVLCAPELKDFSIGGAAYRRISIPDGLSAPLRALYPLKSFGLSHAYTPGELTQPDLIYDITARINALRRVYDFMYSIRPERDDTASGDAFERISGGTQLFEKENF